MITRNLSAILDEWQRVLRRSRRPEDREFADDVFDAHRHALALEEAVEDLLQIREALGLADLEEGPVLVHRNPEGQRWDAKALGYVLEAIGRGREVAAELEDEIARREEAERKVRAVCEALGLDEDSDAVTLANEIEDLKDDRAVAVARAGTEYDE